MRSEMHPIENIIQSGVQWLRLVVETTGAIMVAIGLMVVVWAFVRVLMGRQEANYNQIRLSFARYLALALEFQLAADILSTAIAPGWEEIGRLGAIAIIRSALNFSLMKEMKEEQAQSESPALSSPAKEG